MLDPENMNKPSSYELSTSNFHLDYFRNILAERNLTYSKNNPKEVTNENFLEQLIKRTKDTGHLESFGKFIEFCKFINNDIHKLKNSDH